MATTKASAIGRSILTFRSSSSYPVVMSKRLLSSSSTITRPLPGGFSRSTVSHSHSSLLRPVRLNSIGWCVNGSGSRGINFDAYRPKVLQQFPGMDFEHWRVRMDNKPGGEGATKQQMIDCYVETLAKVVGSEEEAKKKIYNISCRSGFYGFGCEIDEETSNKLRGLPGVDTVIADSYLDPKYKDYGGELYMNGKIVRRSPERQRRIRLLKGELEEDANND